MFMLTLIKSLRHLGLITAICMTPFAAIAEEFRVMMLNMATDDAQHTNVFAPDMLYVLSGDTITFVPTDAGHNTASKRGMMPDGAEPWNSPLNEEFSVILTVPGVYGYVCLPHYEMGMVGLIVVGEGLPNLDDSSKVRHPGAARAAFREIFARIDAP